VSEEAHARARATDALDRVKFEAARRTPVSSLSFGDLRKLEIARALVGRPRLLLLDEPTSGLEPASAEDILIRLRELQGEGSEPMTVLLIEHNVPLVFAHSDRVTAMAAGSAVVTGTPDEVRVNPEVRSSYLGEQIELAEETASLVPPTGKS
jgi:branched-chain amino acid transport system ATP-binding protein